MKTTKAFLLAAVILPMWLDTAFAQTSTPYTNDANTVLLDHFDGGMLGSISAFQQNGQSCGNTLPTVTPNYSFGPSVSGLSQALTLYPPVGMPAGSSTYVEYGGYLLSQANGTAEFCVFMTNYANGFSLGQYPYNGACSGYTLNFYIDPAGQLGAGAWIAFSMNSGTNIVPLNAWTHVAATWGSAGAKLYINGVLVGSDSNTGHPASGYGGNVFFNGNGTIATIDEFRISNIQRTSFILMPLTITKQPTNTAASTGGTTTLTVGVSGTPPFTYQWALNRTNIVGATNATLTLTNLYLANVGLYTVTISNVLGSVTSTGAILTMVDLKMFAGVVVNGPLGSNYLIQATSNLLSSWTTLTNVALPTQPYIYIDYSSPTNSQQFYRAVSQ